MALGTSGNTEELQKREDRVTKEHVDILKNEGKITDGMTLSEVNQVLLKEIIAGEYTSSVKSAANPKGTHLNNIPDNRAGTTVILNGENRSSGSTVGVGQWVGTISGSVDYFKTGSGFDTFHFTHFSGSLSTTGFSVGMTGSVDYGRVIIGKPVKAEFANSFGFIDSPTTVVPTLRCIPFSGSFIVDHKDGTEGFTTTFTGSAAQARENGTGSVDNEFIPGVQPQGQFFAKWISGSFNRNSYTYASVGQISMSQDIGTEFYTSSNFTVDDLNAISQSSFVGSICLLTGSLAGNFATQATTFYGGQQQNNIFGHSELNAVCEFAFGVGGTGETKFAGEFENSGSLTNNNNTGAIINSLTVGALFAIAPTGSGITLVSGSIESIEGQGFCNRGPSTPFDQNKNANSNFHNKKRQSRITGARDNFQLKKLKETKSQAFVPTGRKMTSNPLR